MLGCVVEGRDGIIGEIKGVYFDDREWVLRYVLLETNAWFNRRHVAVLPSFLRQRDWGAGMVRADLSRGQAKEGPGVDSTRPISRHQEMQIHQYYEMPRYWDNGGESRAINAGGPRTLVAGVLAGEATLRNAKDMCGFGIKAHDGRSGSVSDFIVDDDRWTVCYIIVAVGNWCSGKKALISPAWVGEVSAVDEDITVGLSRDMIKSSPAYDPTMPFSRPFADKLVDHYGVPGYGRADE
jgi:hypothetical protein